MVQDLRYALRMMAAQPLFTIMVVLSLALGIGANTAIYSFMDAVLMRTLPVQDPDSLVVLNWHSRIHPPVARHFNGSIHLDSKLGVTSGNYPYPVFDLLHCFAGLAVVIACVGLYGMMAYRVARRTNEIGIRMALGAERGRIIWMVIREVLFISVAGIAIGVPAALAMSQFVKAFLFQMKPNDPLAIGSAATAMLAAAILAGYWPAWRASKVDPWTALRDE